MTVGSTDGRVVVRPREASAFFDHCPDGAALIDRQGRLLAVNPAACAMLVQPEQALIGRFIDTVVDRVDRARLRRFLAGRDDSGAARLDVTCLRGDHSTFIGAMCASSPGPGGTWVTLRDVTTRRRAEQALESLSELTTQLLEGAPLSELMAGTAAAARSMLGGAAAWISTASEDGSTIVVVAQDSDSPDVPDMRGRSYPLQSVLAGTVAIGSEPVLIDDLSSERSGASEAGRALGFGPALGVPLRHGGRHFGSLIVAARPGRHGYGSRDLATAGILARSASVALALATVQADLSELAALYSESPDGVLLTSASGQVMAANRAARAMFAMTEPELVTVGLPGLEGSVPGFGPAPGAVEERGELTYRRPDGTLLIGDVISVPAGSASGDARRWTVVRDVTDRKRTEEILRGLTDLTMALLGREPLEEILNRSAAHARRLVGGVAAYAATLSESGEEVVTVAEDAPPGYSLLGTSLSPQRTPLGRAVIDGESLVVEDPTGTGDPVLPGLPPALGTALVVPLRHKERSFGALVVAAEKGAPAFDAADLSVAEIFAGSAALALDLSNARASLALVEERERIAKNLHDRVIQHLFGTGLGLQAVIGRPAEQMNDAIDRTVAALDRIITEIRSTIFDLTGGGEI